MNKIVLNIVINIRLFVLKFLLIRQLKIIESQRTGKLKNDFGLREVFYMDFQNPGFLSALAKSHKKEAKY